MARNRGKRPGTSSGPQSPNANQVPKADQATGDSGAEQVGKSVSPAAMNDGKPADAQDTVAAGGSGAAPNRVAPSAGAESKTMAQTGSAPSSKAGAAKALPAKTTPNPPAGSGGSRGSSGFWPGLLGGVIGGAAMALALSIYWPGGGVVSQLQSTTTDLAGRLSTAETELEAIGSLSDRVAAVEAAPAEGDGLAARLDDFDQQLAALSGGGVGAPGGEAVINDRVDAIEQQVSTLGNTVASTFDAQQSTKDAMAALQDTLSTSGTVIEATGQQTAALSSAVDTLQQTTEKIGADVGALSDRVGQTESKLDYIGGEYQRAAAMVVALGDVDRSISRAEPYEAALQSLRALGKDDPSVDEALSTLEPMAVTGVPTLAALQESFGEVGSRILLAEEGDETLADQVSDNLFGIINMRPAGAVVEGDDSRAIVARTQAKLSAGDLEGSIAELSGLSEAAREKASGWIADAEARLAADAAIADLRAHARGLLAKGS